MLRINQHRPIFFFEVTGDCVRAPPAIAATLVSSAGEFDSNKLTDPAESFETNRSHVGIQIAALGVGRQLRC